MSKLKLTVACDDYDYLQPLRDGRVQPEGIDLNLFTVESGIRHYRMNNYGEYDALSGSTGFRRYPFSHVACFAIGSVSSGQDLESKSLPT